jgi:hypothetical protein
VNTNANPKKKLRRKREGGFILFLLAADDRLGYVKLTGGTAETELDSGTRGGIRR